MQLVTLMKVAFAFLLCGTPSVAAQDILGSAQSFAVLGGSTVTNTGPSVVTGNLGVSPGSAVIGFPPGTVIGTMHVTDAVASQAQADALTAYNAMAGFACDVDLTGQDLGGLTLVPGVYCFSSSAQLTGPLTLDAQGNSSAEFVFQIGSSLTTASNSSVTVINGGTECNVFWLLGSSATIGTASTFVGNLLATASITLTTGVSVAGRALALNAAVTMDTNAVSIPSTCSCIPISQSYGSGWAGTLGVPVISASNPPAIGGEITIIIDNSSTAATMAFLIVGVGDTSIPTGVGGTLLVTPSAVLLLPLPVGQLSITDRISAARNSCGDELFLQVITQDSGASNNMSFTPGLRLTVGY